MTELLTISELAMRIFLTNYYNSKEKPIPLIIKKGVFNDIYQLYYNSRVKVYNSTSLQGNTLYYYSVNSLYSFASLNPMPSTKCVYIECIKETVEIDNLFKFFYCKITI